MKGEPGTDSDEVAVERKEEETMDLSILKGKWKQARGKIKEEWGELTDDELDQVEGESEKLIGLLQEKYGYTKEKAEAKVSELLEGL